MLSGDEELVELVYNQSAQLQSVLAMPTMDFGLLASCPCVCWEFMLPVGLEGIQLDSGSSLRPRRPEQMCAGCVCKGAAAAQAGRNVLLPDALLGCEVVA